MYDNGHLWVSTNEARVCNSAEDSLQGLCHSVGLRHHSGNGVCMLKGPWLCLQGRYLSGVHIVLYPCCTPVHWKLTACIKDFRFSYNLQVASGLHPSPAQALQLHPYWCWVPLMLWCMDTRTVSYWPYNFRKSQLPYLQFEQYKGLIRPPQAPLTPYNVPTMPSRAIAIFVTRPCSKHG